MTCYYPKYCWRKKRVKGKHGYYEIKEPSIRGCGYCSGCKLEKARQWAMRCVHEASLHDENSFITLTYNNENLPPDLSVHKRELQLFFKRLRKALNGKDIRYYACGEYGARLGRPHYHACLFGHDFPDKEIIHKGRIKYYQNRFTTKNPSDLYTSPFLEKVWGNGFVTIGEVTLESAGYVARYCMKKISGKKSSFHYQNRLPEFALMSRRPSIGKRWFEKYKSDCYPKDFVTFKGHKCKPPMYYDYLLEKVDPEMLYRIKEKRQKEGEKNAELKGRQREYAKKGKELIIKSMLKRNYELGDKN